MTANGELDSDIVEVLNIHFDDIRAEQKVFQNFLTVDFSNVLKEYNDYLFNDAELITNSIEDMLEEVEEIDEIEEIEEVEELEEL